MTIGLVGPADGDDRRLREALEFLIGDADVSQTVYLGADDAIGRVVRGWAQEIAEGEPTENGFLSRAAQLAQAGTAPEIRQFLDSEQQLARLATIQIVPTVPTRAIEMIEGCICTLVHDKSVLDEEDIANSALVVYGKSSGVLLRRFGPRYFFTPGPLKEGKVAILDTDEEGNVTVALFAPSGAPLWREALLVRANGKVQITQ